MKLPSLIPGAAPEALWLSRLVLLAGTSRYSYCAQRVLERHFAPVVATALVGLGGSVVAHHTMRDYVSRSRGKSPRGVFVSLFGVGHVGVESEWLTVCHLPFGPSDKREVPGPFCSACRRYVARAGKRMRLPRWHYRKEAHGKIS